MSMLSSCTLLSLAPGKFSPAALQLRIKQPAVSSSVVALPMDAPRYKVSSRALRLVCHAHTYDDSLPTSLVHASVGDHIKWRINENKDDITLEFDVGDKTDARTLEVTTTKDQSLNVCLFSRYKSDGSDGSPATSLDARLLISPGHDKENVIKAKILSNGWLHIIVDKPRPQTKDIIVTEEKTRTSLSKTKQKTETQSSQNSK